MNDNEIIKALECCKTPTSTCNDCPMGQGLLCFDYLKGYAIDLINRQKAEIERLHKCVKTEEEVRVIAKETIRAGVNIIRAEAIKEFAERLKATPYRFREERTIYFDKPPITKMVLFVDDNDIDNLAKEMKEQ